MQFSQSFPSKGTTKQVEIKRGDIEEALAAELIAGGATLELEVTDTNTVTLIAKHEKVGVLARKNCRNGPKVKKVVDDLIADAHFKFVEEGLDEILVEKQTQEAHVTPASDSCPLCGLSTNCSCTKEQLRNHIAVFKQVIERLNARSTSQFVEGIALGMNL